MIRIKIYIIVLLQLFLILSIKGQTINTRNQDLYLIIVSDDYVTSSALATLKTFREQDFTVQVVTGTSIGTTKDDFRNYIRYLMPNYLLLVGKYGDFPIHIVNYIAAEVESYNYYIASSLTGHPAPDIPMGLFFAEDETELSNIVNKTIYSENNLSSYPNEFYGHAGSKEPVYPWPVEFNEEILAEMYDRYFAPNGFDSTMSTAYDSSPNDAMTDVDVINSGIHYMIYHGHGKISRWSFGMGVNGLPWLNNTIYPTILSFSCLTGSFSGEIDGNIADCYAQKIVANEHGAVAFFGAYHLSGRGMNPLMEGVVNGLFNDTVINRLGDAIIYGYNNFINPNTVNNYYPTVTELERTRSAWQFHLFGDPAFKTRENGPTDTINFIRDNDFFNIYPNPANPANGIVSIQTNKNWEKMEFCVYNLQGKELLRTFNQTEIDIRNLPSGLYFVKIEIDDIIKTSKMIIE